MCLSPIVLGWMRDAKVNQANMSLSLKWKIIGREGNGRES